MQNQKKNNLTEYRVKYYGQSPVLDRCLYHKIVEAWTIPRVRRHHCRVVTSQSRRLGYRFETAEAIKSRIGVGRTRGNRFPPRILGDTHPSARVGWSFRGFVDVLGQPRLDMT
jgi:hypothetical protein